jgi:hypothetical protein
MFARTKKMSLGIGWRVQVNFWAMIQPLGRVCPSGKSHMQEQMTNVTIALMTIFTTVISHPGLRLAYITLFELAHIVIDGRPQN